MSTSVAELLTLAECPIGLFRCNGELCLKTEYGNNEGRIDAYIVSSGEFFWGSTSTPAEQRKVMVEPVSEASLSPAPVGVTDEMVQKFITASRDEDAGYRDWTEAVTAGLNAALASHEPAPTDTQEGDDETCTLCSGTGWYEGMERFCDCGDGVALRPTDPQEGPSGAMKARVIAWQGYFPGAGSINSATNLTKSEYRAKQWEKDGATVTALVTLASFSASQQEVGRLRDILAKTEQEFEAIRYGLINHLNGPERSLFWKAVSARDRIRAGLGGQSNG